MKIFVSHSSTDKWAARQICKELEARSIDVFLDEKNIESGDSIDDAVDQHLVECDELLLLVSPASLSSAWVLIEVGGARALKKRLVPILLHVGANELPAPISRGLARDINELDRYLDEAETRSMEPRPRRQRTDAQPARTPRKRPEPRTFEVGDVVELPSLVPTSTTGHDGLELGWNSDMTNLLGQTGTVTGHANDGSGAVHVDVDDGTWYWLPEWLTPVDPTGTSE